MAVSIAATLRLKLGFLHSFVTVTNATLAASPENEYA